MPSNSQERIEVGKAYSGPKWQLKVNKMTDAQVHAIYVRLRSQGVIK